MVSENLQTRQIRVVLVDDHAMVRQGIRDRLAKESDISVVGEAENREAGIALVDQLLPDVVVLDIRLHQDSGIEVAKKLRADHPQIKILILSAYDYDQYVRALARVRVDGYISKENSQEELVQAIREVVVGGAVLTPKVASKVMKAMSEQPMTVAPPWSESGDRRTHPTRDRSHRVDARGHAESRDR
ncbi:MAG: response regulator transcription factor [Chloroflexi bacterium]|nr:response regulator transcription factor [Chloroflexota bacterium]